MQKPTQYKLQNGASVILVPQKGATSMTLLVLMRVGSRYESPNTSGASHFIEHMMFKGTKRRPRAQVISSTLDRYGAEYNAFTGKDMTGYYIKMDAAQTPLAIDLLHDMLAHSLFERAEVDRERGVIVEEINMYEDNPTMHMDDMLEEALFPNSTLGWNIAGPRDIVKKISQDELVDYKNRYYIPERMTVVIAGKIEPGVKSLLAKTFGKMKRLAHLDDLSYVPFKTPVRLENPVAVQNKNTEQVQLGLGFHGIPLGSPELPTASVLATILGAGMSSRLFINIRERLGLCYSIHAAHEPLEDIGIFSVAAGLDKKRVHEAVGAIRKELERIVSDLVTPAELRRAKDQIRGRTMLAFEDSAMQASWYGKQWTFQKTLETPEDRMKKIERVTAKGVKNMAHEIFKPEHMAAVVIGPFEAAEMSKLLNWNHPHV